MTLQLANPHKKMTGLARLQDHTLSRLSRSSWVGAFIGMFVIVSGYGGITGLIVGYVAFCAGYLLASFANTAIRKRNAAWRPLKSPVKIADIKYVLTSYDSKPGQPHARCEIKFENEDAWYELLGTLPNYIGMGSSVLGDISLDLREARLLHKSEPAVSK